MKEREAGLLADHLNAVIKSERDIGYHRYVAFDAPDRNVTVYSENENHSNDDDSESDSNSFDLVYVEGEDCVERHQDLIVRGFHSRMTAAGVYEVIVELEPADSRPYTFMVFRLSDAIRFIGRFESELLELAKSRAKSWSRAETHIIKRLVREDDERRAREEREHYENNELFGLF